MRHWATFSEFVRVQRIDPHDEIKNLIADETTKKDKEAAASGNLKPDLVIQSQGRVFVVDVTVRHEDGNLLAQVRQAKRKSMNRCFQHSKNNWERCLGKSYRL
jgi:uncharacterized protein involved in exopolysaccharide biosynthesis